MKSLLIGKIARQAGVPVRTIRYYEGVGLLPQPLRTPSGYRLYAISIVDRLLFIKKAQVLGLRLKDIKSILDLSDRGSCPCGHVQQVLNQNLGELRQKIADLKDLEKKITAAMHRRFPPNFKSRGSAICPKIELKPLTLKGALSNE